MKPKTEAVYTPVMRVTLYDSVSSWAISLFFGVALICGVVVLMFMSTRPPKPIPSVPVELEEESPGGTDDGVPGETLRVDSPDPEVRNAVAADSIPDQVEISEAMDVTAEVTDGVGTRVVQQTFDTRTERTGNIGSSKGTGTRGPLGEGTGTGGYPRAKRWFIKFNDRLSLEDYIKQLQFFGIELGALLPDGRLAYLSDLNKAVPSVRYVTTGDKEDRLYMTWQGGERRTADVQVFAKAGIEIRGDTPIFHFYPKRTENTLAQLELAYKNRSVKTIKRTYFAVEPAGGGYQFVVIRQNAYQ